MVSIGLEPGRSAARATPAAAAPSAAGRGSWGRRLKQLLYVSPTVLALLYFGVIASDRYVSQAQFIIRTASRPVGAAGFGSFLQMAGLGRSQDDVFSVQSFLGSRDAVSLLVEKLPIREYYADAGIDPIARFPSLLYGQTLEELHRYLGWMISTSFSTNTGITTLRVQAFQPEHARLVADTLLALSEQMVNRMNERIHSDAVRLAETEVKHNEDRLVAAQIAITRFRNDELTIDPASSSIIVTELVARLSAELAQAQTMLREMSASTPDGPLIPSMRRRIAALEVQIDTERRKISGESGGLAGKLAIYERLVLEREFAKTMLANSVRSLDTARVEGRRQQLYLERITQPAAADYPVAPERVRMIFTILGANALALLVGWLIYAGVAERVAEQQHG
ncbi:MAG: capsule biosynthesis protein [Hyphomicrobiaceae bacterium]